MAQFVPMVPMEKGQLPMATAYTRNMTPAKMGRASTRLVTMRSILSDRDRPVRFFFTQEAMALVMYSYRSLVIMDSASSSRACSQSEMACSTRPFTSALRVSLLITRSSRSNTLMAYHRSMPWGKAEPSADRMVSSACSTGAE